MSGACDGGWLPDAGGWVIPGGGGGGTAYTGIPPSTSTTIEEELDWRARHMGDEVVITSHADLEFFFPADGGGVHHAIGPVRQTGTVVLLAGGEIDQGTTGSWRSSFASKVAIVGNSTGPVMRGNPLVAQGVAFVQVNPGGECVFGESTSGDPSKTIVLRECILTDGGSGAGAGTFANFQGPITMENVQIAGTTGLTFTSIASLARFVGLVGSNLAGPGARMFTVDSGAFVAGGFQWTACSMITNDPAQRMILIDPAAILPGSGTGLTDVVGMRATSCQMVATDPADTGKIFDETGIAESDQRVFATSNLYGEDSLTLGQCEFLTTGIPISKTYGAPNVFEDIPRDNGAGGGIMLDVVSQRFDLIEPLGEGVTTASVNAGGSYSPDGVGLAASQASTSGTGTGASFTVTVAGGVVTTVDSIVTPGEGYTIGDTITLVIAGEIVAAVLDVDAVEAVSTEWYLRYNGPLTPGVGVVYSLSSEAAATGSQIQTRAEWRQGALDAWKPIGGSTALRIQVNNAPGYVAGRGKVLQIALDAHFKVTIANDNASAATDILAISAQVEG